MGIGKDKFLLASQSVSKEGILHGREYFPMKMGVI